MISSSVDLHRLLPQSLVRRIAERVRSLRAPRLPAQLTQQQQTHFCLPAPLKPAKLRAARHRSLCSMTVAQAAPPATADGAMDEVESLRQQVAQLQVHGWTCPKLQPAVCKEVPMPKMLVTFESSLFKAHY